MSADNAKSFPMRADRRGACPSLSQPMQTGDGLLVRLRPLNGALSVDQLLRLAQAAATYGNGILEITARGSLQIRGLTHAGMQDFAAAVSAAGLAGHPGPAIEVSPLHGLDPLELEDASLLAEMIRTKMHDLLISTSLAPKLSILVDGGGRFTLHDLDADIRVRALENKIWHLAIAGTEGTAQPIARGHVEAILPTLRKILEALTAGGPATRTRNLDISLIEKSLHQDAVSSKKDDETSSRFTGLYQLDDKLWIVGLRLRFGQIEAGLLKAFLEEAAAIGAADVRLAPDRHLILTMLTENQARAICSLASVSELSIDPQDPARFIAACPGLGACGSATYSTKQAAALMAEGAPDLLDGSLHLHLSGCGKGCAHPAPALTMTGRADGIGVSLEGRAGSEPQVLLSGGSAVFALQNLSREIGKERRTGESAAACLKRLGEKRALGALLQG